MRNPKTSSPRFSLRRLKLKQFVKDKITSVSLILLAVFSLGLLAGASGAMYLDKHQSRHRPWGERPPGERTRPHIPRETGESGLTRFLNEECLMAWIYRRNKRLLFVRNWSQWPKRCMLSDSNLSQNWTLSLRTPVAK